MANQLVFLPDIERLSPLVIRILGGNLGKFTLQGTNTYLIGRGPTRLLLDTGEGIPNWLHSLQSVLTSENCTLSSCLLSHWHQDHTLGVPHLLSLFPSLPIHKSHPSLHGSTTHTPWHPIHPSQRFSNPGATLRAVPCPGHTVDHMAFVLEEEDAMFTGDNVLGQGTAVFEDLGSYMASLEKMKGEFGGRAYPGHGPVIEKGREKIEEYILHRRERERQVMEVLGSGDEEEGWTSMGIVKVVYKDVPENLHGPAEGGVRQVLEKLRGEGRVVCENGDRWTLSGSAKL